MQGKAGSFHFAARDFPKTAKMRRRYGRVLGAFAREGDVCFISRLFLSVNVESPSHRPLDGDSPL